MQAFLRGEASKDNELMVFDWERAAKIIKDFGAQHAEAGLANDWEYTGGIIFHNGKPVKKEDTYTYLASTWATPQLKIKNELIEC